jgi:hypothetical protein
MLIKDKELFMKDHPETKCIDYTVLINETKKCCCGRDLQREFYRFSCELVQGQQKIFLAGPDCGKKLIEIGNLVVPQFFDPFQPDVDTYTQQPSKGRIENIQGQLSSIEETPENREMQNAISLLLCMWGDVEKTILFGIRETLRKKPHMKPTYKQFKSLDNAINNTKVKGATLREKFQLFASINSRSSKQFDFPGLESLCKYWEIDCCL